MNFTLFLGIVIVSGMIVIPIIIMIIAVLSDIFEKWMEKNN